MSKIIGKMSPEGLAQLECWLREACRKALRSGQTVGHSPGQYCPFQVLLEQPELPGAGAIAHWCGITLDEAYDFIEGFDSELDLETPMSRMGLRFIQRAKKGRF